MYASEPSPDKRSNAIERMQQIMRALEDMEMIDQTIDPQLHYLVTDEFTRLHKELERFSTVD